MSVCFLSLPFLGIKERVCFTLGFMRCKTERTGRRKTLTGQQKSGRSGRLCSPAPCAFSLALFSWEADTFSGLRFPLMATRILIQWLVCKLPGRPLSQSRPQGSVCCYYSSTGFDNLSSLERCRTLWKDAEPWWSSVWSGLWGWDDCSGRHCYYRVDSVSLCPWVSESIMLPHD